MKATFDKLQDEFFNFVFGEKARIQNAEWLEKVSELEWLFSSKLLREKILKFNSSYNSKISF